MISIYVILSAALWIMCAAIRSVRIEANNTISDFELQRRAGAQDPGALTERSRRPYLNDVRVLRYIFESLLFIILVSLLIAAFDVLLGVTLALLAQLFIPTLAKIPTLKNWAQVQYEKLEPILLDIGARWHNVLKAFAQNGPGSAQYRIYSQDELLQLAKDSEGVFSKDELLLLTHGLEFKNKKVADVMTPRSVMDIAEVNEVVGPVVLTRLHKTGHSRIPVIQKDTDHVVGMLYMHDLVPLNPKIKKIKDAMRDKVFYVRVDQSLEHALHAFLRTRSSLFIVVNEYRETVGVLSLEDVIEALVGRKIIDEFDQFHDLRAVAETNPRQNNQPKKHEDV